MLSLQRRQVMENLGRRQPPKTQHLKRVLKRHPKTHQVAETENSRCYVFNLANQLKNSPEVWQSKSQAKLF
jgi:hypothetical protein